MSAGGRRNGLQGRYCFLCFFRPPDERKNPDWLDLMNSYTQSILLTGQRPVIQTRKGLLIFTFNKADKSRDRFELILEETHTRLLTVGLKILLSQSRSHQINMKTEYKPNELSMYLSFFKHCIDYGTAALW